MEKQTYQINEITKVFKKSSFSKVKIPSDIFYFSEIIYNKDALHPFKQHYLSKEELEKIDYFKYLIFDEKYKKASITNREQYKIYNMDHSQNAVTSVEPAELKVKSTNIEFQNFKKTLELESNTSVNVMIFNNKIVSNENIFITSSNISKKENVCNDIRSMTSEDFFKENFDDGNINFIKSTNYTKDSISDCVYKVNDSISYPKNLPLWYVYHHEAESAYGPLSSEEIEEMLKTNLLDEKSQIRLIDVFQYRGCKQFDYFDVKELQLDNFAESIKISSLAYNFKLNNKNIKSSNTQDKKGNFSYDRGDSNFQKSKISDLFLLFLINKIFKKQMQILSLQQPTILQILLLFMILFIQKIQE